MEFEDLVDMEWVNAHTTSTHTTPYIKEEPTYTVFSSQQDSPISTDMYPPVHLSLSTIDQIKRLIEIARQHLALRDQLQSQWPQDSSVKQEPTLAEDMMSLEAYAESDGIDIKRLTPKERRQLRNKISARNFRVRRKEYITALEAQVDDHKKHAQQLGNQLEKLEEENKQLRSEVDTLKRQNQLLLQKATPSSPRMASPLHKDLSVRGSKPSETYRPDYSILVSHVVMPHWDIDQIIQQKTKPVTIPSASDQHSMMWLAGHTLAWLVQHQHLIPNQAYTPSTEPIPSAIEQLYDNLILSSLRANNNTAFCW
ncbi:uncharacterized protein BYT42DRAFT_498232 [Radiomyces spectabilis]|uniref:uncharacterized protein n=1 Tax=Radiomyces spectabilis TaxID=64574 RepID=UPI00221F15D0|nr:uncharacterized protein BYT42DRAFT_498232 [Radiomyces spectabilis]KAI8376331.1 hypothetical protein BYT42DRAFT_498232 [Radiomyces spectabilis]